MERNGRYRTDDRGDGNGMVTTWSVVILMNTMIYLGFAKVLMTLAALKFDGLEAIAPCVLEFLLIIEDQCCIWVRGILIVVKTRFWNGDYVPAMDIAKKQVEDGSHLIDIKVDDGILDGMLAMQKFVKIVITEPEVSKSPFILDAFKFEIVMAGLKWYQGKKL